LNPTTPATNPSHIRIEPIARPLACRGVHARIGHVLEPQLPLLIEIAIVEERAAVDEIAAHVADGPLDFPFRLRPIRPARARREPPVMREAQKLRIANERATLEPQVARDHRSHLIEE
jgi:hypothetical protein